MRDFIRALKSAYAVGVEVLADDEPLAADAFDWGALARVSAPHFHVAPGVSCMLGPMDAAPKARYKLPFASYVWGDGWVGSRGRPMGAWGDGDVRYVRVLWQA